MGNSIYNFWKDRETANILAELVWYQAGDKIKEGYCLIRKVEPNLPFLASPLTGIHSGLKTINKMWTVFENFSNLLTKPGTATPSAVQFRKTRQYHFVTINCRTLPLDGLWCITALKIPYCGRWGVRVKQSVFAAWVRRTHRGRREPKFLFCSIVSIEIEIEHYVKFELLLSIYFSHMSPTSTSLNIPYVSQSWQLSGFTGAIHGYSRRRSRPLWRIWEVFIFHLPWRPSNHSAVR